jgi:hypothetical protein
MQHPGLSEDGYYGSFGGQERLNPRIVAARQIPTARRAEGGDGCLLKFQMARPFEESYVARV